MQFTAEELEALKQLINIAVMARGMNVAEASVQLVHKINAMQRIMAAEQQKPRATPEAA